MELFNKKYVHFMWDDSLNGKDAFFSDHIDDLQNYVNKNRNKHINMVHNSGDPSYPFSTGEEGSTYRFIYYDPNYNYKLAFSKGSKVKMCINKSKDKWVYVNDLDDLDDPTGCYRIVLKDEDLEELVTYEELAEWLTKGNGLVKDLSTNKVSTGLNFTVDDLDKEVEIFLIRRHGDKGWHSPTKKYVYNK